VLGVPHVIGFLLRLLAILLVFFLLRMLALQVHEMMAKLQHIVLCFSLLHVVWIGGFSLARLLYSIPLLPCTNQKEADLAGERMKFC